MNISNIITSRNISEALHFTTNRGVVGTLAKGALLSRHRLPLESYLQHILHVNSAVRPEVSIYFDKSQNWLDYVNLSISEINRRYYEFSKGWHVDKNIWWAILSFDASIMTHDNVIFTTTNNGYDDKCQREGGVEGLNALFSPNIERKPGWTVRRNTRPPNLTTCEQAEVLYPESVPVKYLNKIYVTDGEHHDNVCSWLQEFGNRTVQVIISPEKFIGKKN